MIYCVYKMRKKIKKFKEFTCSSILGIFYRPSCEISSEFFLKLPKTIFFKIYEALKTVHVSKISIATLKNSLWISQEAIPIKCSDFLPSQDFSTYFSSYQYIKFMVCIHAHHNHSISHIHTHTHFCKSLFVIVNLDFLMN